MIIHQKLRTCVCRTGCVTGGALQAMIEGGVCNEDIGKEELNRAKKFALERKFPPRALTGGEYLEMTNL